MGSSHINKQLVSNVDQFNDQIHSPSIHPVWKILFLNSYRRSGEGRSNVF